MISSIICAAFAAHQALSVYIGSRRERDNVRTNEWSAQIAPYFLPIRLKFGWFFFLFVSAAVCRSLFLSICLAHKPARTHTQRMLINTDNTNVIQAIDWRHWFRRTDTTSILTYLWIALRIHKIRTNSHKRSKLWQRPTLSRFGHYIYFGLNAVHTCMPSRKWRRIQWSVCVNRWTHNRMKMPGFPHDLYHFDQA